MPHERFYYNGSLTLNQKIKLEAEEEKHLRVMRIRVGDEVEIINGNGFLAKAILEDQLKIVDLTFQEPFSHHVTIAQGIPRSNRLDFILEKGTELGMDEIILFPAELSEKKEISENLMHRLQSICIAATKQSGRLYLPKIKIMPPLKNWGKITGTAFFGDVDPQAKPFHQEWHKQKEILFFVGPEKGFTKREEEHLKALGASGVKLHPNILRTDTAPIAFLSIVHHLAL